MALNWKDTTSYSQGGSREPRCWSVNLFGGMRLSVIRKHRDYPETWIVSVTQISFEQPLPDVPLDDVEAAQAAALLTLRSYFEKLSNSMIDPEEAIPLDFSGKPSPGVIENFLLDVLRGVVANGTLLDRVATDGLQGTALEVWRRLNAPGHPVRDGLILLGHSLMTPPPEAEIGVQWFIPHPGTLKHIKCLSFENAMISYFEGFNIPYKKTDGVAEPFAESIERVRDYFRRISPVV